MEDPISSEQQPSPHTVSCSVLSKFGIKPVPEVESANDSDQPKAVTYFNHCKWPLLAEMG